MLSDSTAPVLVANAILYQGNRVLMQLRDDLPTIVHPGIWAFFGGHMEPGEDPAIAVVRELEEEIGYTAPEVTLFRCYDEGDVRRYVFAVPLPVELEALTLMEGQDFGWLTIADIQRGDRFSEVTGDVRSLGAVHQEILMQFFNTAF